MASTAPFPTSATASGLKVQFLFKLDESGWTETYYTAPDSRGLKTYAKIQADQRLEVLGKQAVLIAVKISTLSQPNNVTRVAIGQPGNAVPAGPDNENPDCDQASAAILIPFRSSVGRRRFYTLRGVPDNWIKHTVATGVDIAVTDAAAKIVDAFVAKLLKAPTLLIRDRVPAPGNPNIGISAIALDVPSGQYRITTDGTGLPVQGDKVVFLKLKGNNLLGLKGVRRVTYSDGVDSFRVDRGPRTDLGTITYLGGGFTQLAKYDYYAATKLDEPYTVSTRKAGRPFAARRGRVTGRR